MRPLEPTPSLPENCPAVADHAMLQRIGAGACGEVWMARSITGALRAVKVVWRERFDHDRTYEREFIGLKNFEPISRGHPGVVDILQVGRNDAEGYFYCVMELADDAVAPHGYTPLTLAEHIRARRRLAPLECARIGAQVAEALSYLHGKGLIHRDVKPSNIIFVNGHPLLADIGLVSSVGAARSFVGTDGFIPPEGPGTPRADIFSFGKTLYEMATGRSRLDFPDLPPDLESNGDSNLFMEINEIILRACAEKADERHASPEEMRGELLLLDAGRSVRRVRRNERLLAAWRRAGLLAGLLFLAVAGALAWERRIADNARREAASQARQRLVVEEKERHARENLYAADMNLAQQAIGTGNYGRAESLLAEYIPAIGQPDLRGFEWRHFWKQVRGDSIGALSGHSNLVSSLVLGRKPGQLFSASFDSTIREWDMAGRREIRRWSLPGALFTSLALSPSGSVLAAEGDRPFSLILNLESGAMLTNNSTASSRITFAPGGDKLARGSHFKLFDTNGVTQIIDQQFRVMHTLPDSGARPVFSPTGTLLLTASWSHSAKLWSWPGMEPLGELAGAGVVLSSTFSPDGSMAATVSRDGQLRLWDIATRTLLAEKTAHGGGIVWSAAFSPDGLRIATGGNDQAVRVWEAATLRELHVYRGHGSEVWSVIWSEDGSQIISTGKDADIRIWTASPPRDTGEISSAAQRPVFSPDGRRVAAMVRGGGASVWETASGQKVAHIPQAFEIGGFSGSGEQLVILGGRNEIQKINVADGQVLETRAIPPPSEGQTKRLLSENGRWLASGYRGGVVVAQDTSGEKEPRHLSGLTEMIVAFAFSPDQKLLLAGSIDRSARLWDLETGETLGVYTGHRMGVGSVAFSPDARLIATGSWDDTVHVWSVGTGERLMVLPGHEGGVQAVAFTPDNRTLLCLGGSGMLKCWSLAARRESGQFRLRTGVHQGWVAVSPDGESVAVVSQDETLSFLRGPRENSKISR